MKTLSAFPTQLTIQTVGNSMYPIFLDKDVITVKKTAFSTLQVDDLITFQEQGKLITHRIIYKQKDYAITKGDTNMLHDGKIKPEQIVGKVHSLTRNGKTLDPNHIYLYQSATYMKEVVAITSLLQKNAIDFVILKGLPLYLSYTKTNPKRLYADCDILVAKKDSKRFFALLSKEGYTIRNVPKAAVPKLLQKSAPEYEMIKRVNSITVSFDIHTEVAFLIKQFGGMAPLYLQTLQNELTNHFLTNKRFISLEKKQFPLLQKEDLILYLCLHIFGHNLKGYNRYDLLNTILQKQKTNFGELEKTIKKYQLENYVYPVFLLLQKYYPVTIPAQFIKAITPEKKILQYIKKHMVQTDILQDETKLKRGTEKFQRGFFLSPHPLYKKMQIFLSPAVAYAIIAVLLLKGERKLRRLFL